MKPDYEEIGLFALLVDWFRDGDIYLGWYDAKAVKVWLFSGAATVERKAHEYGHFLGYGHLPWYAFDVMSSWTPIRIFDRYKLVEKSAKWRLSLYEGA